MVPTVVDEDLSQRLAGRLHSRRRELDLSLTPGDGLSARIDRPTRLQAVGPQAAEHLVVVHRSRGPVRVDRA